MYGSPVIRKPYLYGASTRARAARARATASACALRTIRGPLRYAVQVAIALLAAWFEYGTWLRHAHACSWPSASAADDFRVLVVADPQLLDMRSYPGRSFLLRALGLVVTDAYARKSWKAVTRALSSSKGPGIDGVVFLGDLLDSGIDSMDSNEHSHYVHRFHLLFPLPRARSAADSSLSPPVPALMLPGNHDLGLHVPSGALQRYARERFTDAFGPTQGVVMWHGWQVVWVDSMALLEDGPIGDEARAFVEQVARDDFDGGDVAGRERSGDSAGRERKEASRLARIEAARGEAARAASEEQQDEAEAEALARIAEEEARRRVKRAEQQAPRILLTHIPLWRPDHTPCGPGRESPRPIRQGQGKNYQNELGKDTSQWLLDRLAPTLVYSGDDHDLCVVQHTLESPRSQLASVTETTVKSFSMAMGVRSPGYHLLALGDAGAYAQANCDLPDQIGIWLDVYLRAFVALAIVVLLPRAWRVHRASGASWRLWRKSSTRRHASYANSGGQTQRKKQKTRSISETIARAAAGGEKDGLSSEDEPESDDEAYLRRGDGGYDDSFAADNEGGRRVISAGGGELFYPGHTSQAASYSYHSGLDSEELPTPAASRHARHSSKPGHVRRVSRVWLWSGNDNDSDEDDYMTTRRPASKRGKRAPPFTVLAALIKPLVRGVRILLWRRVLLRGVRKAFARETLTGETLAELAELVWPGVLVAIVVWLWYLF